jgi:hypothetical protein
MTDQSGKVRYDNREEFAEMRDIGTMVYKKHSNSLPNPPKPARTEEEKLFSWQPRTLDMHLRLLVPILGFPF